MGFIGTALFGLLTIGAPIGVALAGSAILCSGHSSASSATTR